MIPDIAYHRSMEPSAGRPRIGTAVHLRLDDALLARVDQWATENGLSRAETVRRLIEAALDLVEQE